MLHWVSANLSTIIVSAVLLAIIIAISTYLIRQRKKGKIPNDCRKRNVTNHHNVR